MWDRPWQHLSPLERTFDGLSAARLIPAGREVWTGKFATLDCPACGGRKAAWWGEIEGRFKIGCSEGCERLEVLHAIGLSGTDVMNVGLSWLV